MLVKIFALADFHLSLGTPGKKMDIFGDQWIHHDSKIMNRCRELVGAEDLLLIPGDLSWAMRLADALLDLNFIHELPGTKIICKGNHDYWWPSLKKLHEALPPTVISVQNSVQRFGKVAIGGVRLWDDRELDFDRVINYKPNPKKNLDQALTADENEAIFQKELIRLEAVLQAFHPEETKILMCHYPPIGLDLESSRAGKLIEHYGVDICVFGHLHQLNTHAPLFGRRGKTNYQLTSCDYLDFTPQLILELPA